MERVGGRRRRPADAASFNEAALFRVAGWLEAEEAIAAAIA
jgi:hypothetical protein